MAVFVVLLKYFSFLPCALLPPQNLIVLSANTNTQQNEISPRYFEEKGKKGKRTTFQPKTNRCDD